MRKNTMRGRTDNFKKIIKIIVFFALFIIIIFLLFGAIIYPSILNDKVATLNKRAKNHYNFFTSYYNELSQIIDIPDKGSYYITGECKNTDYYLAYAEGIVPDETVIYGNKGKEINGYWAINIVDNKIDKVWFSNYRLSINQLHPYFIEDQKKQIKIYEDTMDTKAIGYFEKND